MAPVEAGVDNNLVIQPRALFGDAPIDVDTKEYRNVVGYDNLVRSDVAYALVSHRMGVSDKYWL